MSPVPSTPILFQYSGQVTQGPFMAWDTQRIWFQPPSTIHNLHQILGSPNSITGPSFYVHIEAHTSIHLRIANMWLSLLSFHLLCPEQTLLIDHSPFFPLSLGIFFKSSTQCSEQTIPINQRWHAT